MSTDKIAHWRQKLQESRHALKSLLISLEPAQWDASVYSDGQPWLVKTVIGHLIDAERGMSIHVHKIRKGQETISEGFDLNRWNAGIHERVGDPSPDTLLTNLEETRAKTLEGMAKLQMHEWSLTGRHASRGIITVEQYYETIHGHELMHTGDIKAALGVD